MEEFITKLPVGSLFLICLLLHFLADFNLQGMLGNLKQKVWWEKNYPQPMYKRDYITCGIIHALYWSILTFFPFCFKPSFLYVVGANSIVHYIIDTVKANWLRFSLSTDQSLHYIQIGITVLIMEFLKG